MTAEQLVAELVSIDSVNPDLVPGGAGEEEIAAFVAGWLGDAGLEVELVEAAPGRPSVVAVAPGRGGGASLMLNAHMDTVGVEGMTLPFSPETRDGRLYGRGSYDMKAGLAACMLAGSRLAAEELGGDVVVSAVADEEHASIGTRSVLERRRTDAAIVTEPTGLGVCIAHKGFVWAEIEVEGRAAHGSRPAEGRDAITAMAPVLTRLAELQATLDSASGHPLVGPGSVHASLIEGGQELSSYPASCLLSLERRTAPGESDERLPGGMRGAHPRDRGCAGAHGAGAPTLRGRARCRGGGGDGPGVAGRDRTQGRAVRGDLLDGRRVDSGGGYPDGRIRPVRRRGPRGRGVGRPG